jgi:hypothetical protein
MGRAADLFVGRRPIDHHRQRRTTALAVGRRSDLIMNRVDDEPLPVAQAPRRASFARSKSCNDMASMTSAGHVALPLPFLSPSDV